MKVFNTDVALFATLYIVADSVEEAEAKAREAIRDAALEFSSRREYVGDDIIMTGEQFGPDMPEISLSPAMTFAPLEQQAFNVSLSDEIEETEA